MVVGLSKVLHRLEAPKGALGALVRQLRLESHSRKEGVPSLGQGDARWIWCGDGYMPYNNRRTWPCQRLTFAACSAPGGISHASVPHLNGGLRGAEGNIG